MAPIPAFPRRGKEQAWRLYRHLRGEAAPLTPAFVTALEMSAQAHMAMVAAVAPCIDTAISKTVNVPADYPYADFQHLYLAGAFDPLQRASAGQIGL